MRVDAAHIGLQHRRDRDAAVLVLIVLQDRDERAADREAGAVERVHEARALARLRRDSARSCAAPGNRAQTEQHEISRYVPCPGSHTSMS